MGHPKALTPIEGEPAVRRISRACRDAGCKDVAIVAPPNVALPPLDARVIVNEDPDAGRTRSLQLALRGDALVWPVDHPLAASATARRLMEADGEWILPTFDGRGGHPIVLRGRAVDAVRAAAPDTPLRDALRQAGLHATRLPVEDPGVVANLDSPVDLQREGI